jgi:hypothetical protein
LSRTVRIVFAAVGSPNCELLTMVFQEVYETLFNALFASSRKSVLVRSLIRKVRESDAFSENCRGPVMMFRPALPH